LPIVRLRHTASADKERGIVGGSLSALRCVGILMYDQWKIKTGVEILSLFIVPEDFSDLLRRWRRSQVLLDKTTSG